METVIPFDLDTLCIIAEFAAVLLLLSLIWRPKPQTEQDSETRVEWDWGPFENVFVQALVASGRAIGNRVEEQDCNRLRQLQQLLPDPWRDRLTGFLNASGMDRLVVQWSAERTSGASASCFTLVTLRSHDELMDRHGAMVAELAVRSMGELLQKEISERAIVSRYQPNRFLILRFASNVAECQHAIHPLIEQMNAPEFFSARGCTVALECEAQYWECVRSVDPEQLIRLLEDGDADTESAISIDDKSLVEKITGVESLKLAAGSSEDASIHQSIEHTERTDLASNDPPNEPVPIEREAIAAQGEPVVSRPAVGTEAESVAASTESDRAVEGYATADDIASLFAELQSKEDTSPPTAGAVQDADAVRFTEAVQDAGAVQDAEAVQVPVAVQEVEASAQALKPNEDATLESARDRRATPLEESTEEVPLGAVVPARSIYTDDIESTGIDDDLASLFATVRSSARGSFAYQPSPDSA